MINARIDEKKATPVWVAMGAPLIGIPLLVGLLALADPGREPPEPDADAVVMAEPIDVLQVVDEVPLCPSVDEAATLEG